MNIIQKPSPNFGERKGYKPELFVVHIMAGSLAGTDSWFATSNSQVSAHFGVGFKGEVHQYVNTDKTAWANGIVNLPNFKLYKPNVNPNLYTISIENEGFDLSIAPVLQLQALVELLKSLSAKYNIPLTRDTVIGHYQVDKIRKPNCPAVDKKILDTIVTMCQGDDELVPILVPKSKVEHIKSFLLSL